MAHNTIAERLREAQHHADAAFRVLFRLYMESEEYRQMVRDGAQHRNQLFHMVRDLAKRADQMEVAA